MIVMNNNTRIAVTDREPIFKLWLQLACRYEFTNPELCLLESASTEEVRSRLGMWKEVALITKNMRRLKVHLIILEKLQGGTLKASSIHKGHFLQLGFSEN